MSAPDLAALLAEATATLARLTERVERMESREAETERMLAAQKAERGELLTSKEIAPLIGLSWKVVHEWKASGVIPAAIDEPKCVRFDLAAVRAALAARTIATACLITFVAVGVLIAACGSMTFKCGVALAVLAAISGFVAATQDA